MRHAFMKLAMASILDDTPISGNTPNPTKTSTLSV